MKIIIIDDEEAIREIIRMFLEAVHPFQILEATSGNEAIRMIEANPDLSCIICDYNMPDGNGAVVYQYLCDRNLKIPYILCSSDLPEKHNIFRQNPPYGNVVKPDLFPALETQVLSLIPEPKSPEYVRVRAHTILRHGLLVCDLYLQLNENKYLKVMMGGDTFEAVDFERFESKKIDYLYLKSTDARVLLEHLLKDFRHLSQVPPSSDQQNLALSTNVLEVISDFNQTLGVTAEIEKLIQENIALAIEAIRKNPKLSELYSQLLADPKRYLASHSVMLAHFSCSIANALKWPSDKTFFKLSLASFLHDLSLHSDDLAKIDDADEFNAMAIGEEHREKYFKHPIMSAALTSHIHSVASEVAIIIQQHHERGDGSGFPSGLDHTQISALSAVFIIAENFLAFQNKHGKSSIITFINALPAHLKVGQFRDIISTMTQTIVENEA